MRVPISTHMLHAQEILNLKKRLNEIYMKHTGQLLMEGIYDGRLIRTGLCRVGAEAADRRATEAQVLEDFERLIAAWNEHQAKRTPTNE
jgi:hypothetical protein